MKNIEKIEVGKFYLYGSIQWGPDAIVRIDGMTDSNMWGRKLDLNPITQETFFAFQSFSPRPDRFLRELNDTEVSRVVTLVISKLTKFAAGQDPVDTDIGFDTEARKFIADVFKAIPLKLVPGRQFWAAGTDRHEK